VTQLVKYRHPWLATILTYWPATVLLPIMLGLIAMLAVVTHFWHHHDEQAREVSRRANGGARQSETERTPAPAASMLSRLSAGRPPACLHPGVAARYEFPW
jgi:hypothetical protein